MTGGPILLTQRTFLTGFYRVSASAARREDLRRVGGFQGTDRAQSKERVANAGADLIEPALQLVYELMQAALANRLRGAARQFGLHGRARPRHRRMDIGSLSRSRFLFFLVPIN